MSWICQYKDDKTGAWIEEEFENEDAAIRCGWFRDPSGKFFTYHS